MRQDHESKLQVFDSMEDSVLVTDEGGSVLYLNSAASRYWGFRSEDILGHNAKDIFSTLFESINFQEIHNELEQHGIWRGDLKRRLDSPPEIWVELSICRFAIPDLTGYVMTFRDITPRHFADAERKRLEDQFRQAQKMEAVGRLAGGIAHDFNNLLTGISGNVALGLLDAEPSYPLYDVLVDIGRASERASELTRQLLMFSRRQIIEPRVINLNEVLQNLKKMLARLIGDKIRFQMHFDTQLWPIKFDLSHIEQIIMNMVVNSCDAISGEGFITIETRNREITDESSALLHGVKPGKFVNFVISDSGAGIPAEIIKSIFDPYFTTKPIGKGSGLGLSMVFGAVKQHGGFIEVESELGRGSAFTVWIPAFEQENERRSGDKNKQDAIPVGTETVLVVEDDTIVRSMTVKMLKRLGYTAYEAKNGAEALGVAVKLEWKIDLLLTDVIMPGINGRELARQFIQTKTDLPVLYTSGYTDDVIVHHGVLDASMNFLPKPYSYQQLSEAVRKSLDRKKK